MMCIRLMIVLMLLAWPMRAAKIPALLQRLPDVD